VVLVDRWNQHYLRAEQVDFLVLWVFDVGGLALFIFDYTALNRCEVS
jgi:hypothetical protein